MLYLYKAKLKKRIIVNVHKVVYTPTQKHQCHTFPPTAQAATAPTKRFFAKIVWWGHERSPGKLGQVRRIGDEETASGRFDSEAENKKAFLNFFVTFFFQEKKV